MSFLEGFKKLTQPYDDDDDIFEGADESFAAPKPPVREHAAFEDKFASEAPPAPRQEEKPARKQAQKAASDGTGFLNGLTGKKNAQQPAQPKAKVHKEKGTYGNQPVVLFSPTGFDDACALISYLQEGHSVVLSLDDLDMDHARRVLDFVSGITIALDGKLTPVAGKAYFITPQNVNVIEAQEAN